ncbi:co-chaperone GroES [Candidatus Daviesbacteria bacterium]|nr:co-chaperone GroES [Candidatus Daviesbacteria bacterium]
MAKLNPLAGYVLIEPLDEQETTASGLVMPEKAKEKPAKGKVIMCGEKYTDFSGAFETPFIQCPVKVGDTVCFHRWSGQDIKEGQKEYKLVKFSDLMGIYE